MHICKLMIAYADTIAYVRTCVQCHERRRTYMDPYVHMHAYIYTCTPTYARAYIHKVHDSSLETVAHGYMYGQIGLGCQSGDCIHLHKGRPQPWARTTGTHGFISCMHACIITRQNGNTWNHTKPPRNQSRNHSYFIENSTKPPFYRKKGFRTV